MVELAATGDLGVSKPFLLLNEHLQFSEEKRGELIMVLKWVYDASLDAAVKAKNASTAMRVLKTMRRLGGMMKKIPGIKSKKSSVMINTVVNVYIWFYLFMLLPQAEQKEEAQKLLDAEDNDDEEMELPPELEALDMTPFELELYFKEQAKQRKEKMKELLEVRSQISHWRYVSDMYVLIGCRRRRWKKRSTSPRVTTLSK